MGHSHSRWFFWFHEGCPACVVRRLRYGYRLDPFGYSAEIYDIKNGGRFTYEEKKWILRQVGELK